MIITDSLGAPRKDLDIIKYEDTWPSKVFELMLKEHNYVNFIFTQKALDTDELKRLVEMNLDLYDKEYLFIHIGIVDCARRVMSKKTLKVISILPLVRNIVNFLARKYHKTLTKLYNINYVPLKRFYSNMDFILKQYSDVKKIFLIPILPAGYVQQKKSFRIQFQIENYNNVLKELSNKYNNVEYLEAIYNSFFPLNEENYISDGYHISKKGHIIIYNEISKILFN